MPGEEDDGEDGPAKLLTASSVAGQAGVLARIPAVLAVHKDGRGSRRGLRLVVEAVPTLYWRREDVTEMPANMVELPIVVVVHVEQDMVEGVVGKVSALITELNPSKICLCF